MSQRTRASLLTASLLCTAAPLGAADAPAASSADPVQAIWKTQEVAFYYQSFTTFYSCTSLESKLERILRALGAKDPQVKVRSPECPTGVARMPRVIATVSSPVPATPEAIAERDKGKGTRELAARVQGKSGEASDETEQFAAQWKPVSLSRGALDLAPGDCELIEELKRKVLPKLAVRVVKDGVSCSPNQLTLGQPILEVEALTAIPKPDEKAADDKKK